MATVRRTNILVMSATVTPRDSPELTRVDPTQRLQDYADALKFYIPAIGPVIDGIVFVENSDSDVSSLRGLAAQYEAADRVEFIANYGIHSYPGRDRSYGEFKLLDHAMIHSRLITKKADVIVWKITGRYQVRNLREMIGTAPKEFDLYCDLRKRPIEWADLRFLAWSNRGYERVFDKVADRVGGDPREPVMYRHIKGLTGEPGLRLVTRYRREPLIEGVRGWDNRHYSRGVSRLKYYVRNLARRVAPFLHV